MLLTSLYFLSYLTDGGRDWITLGDWWNYILSSILMVPRKPERGRPRQLLLQVVALYNSFKYFWCCHRTDLRAYSKYIRVPTYLQQVSFGTGKVIYSAVNIKTIKRHRNKITFVFLTLTYILMYIVLCNIMGVIIVNPKICATHVFKTLLRSFQRLWPIFGSLPNICGLWPIFWK